MFYHFKMKKTTQSKKKNQTDLKVTSLITTVPSMYNEILKQSRIQSEKYPDMKKQTHEQLVENQKQLIKEFSFAYPNWRYIGELLRSGVLDPNIRNPNGQLLFDQAVLWNQDEIVDMLLLKTK